MSSSHNKYNTPKDAMDLMNMAEKVFDESNFALSIQYFTHAIKQIKSPKNMAYALYMRGCAYKELGKQSYARKDWLQAKGLGFEHPWSIDLISDALKTL